MIHISFDVGVMKENFKDIVQGFTSQQNFWFVLTVVIMNEDGWDMSDLLLLLFLKRV